MDSRVSTANSTVSDYRDEDTRRRERTWREMDKKYNISKRKQNEVMKLKKINTVAQILLDSKVSTMEASYAREDRELTKKRRQVEKELHLLSPSKSIVLPPIPNQNREETTPTEHLTNSLNYVQNIQCSECRFGTSKFRCRNFPCCLPKTYTSIGFQLTPKTYSTLHNYQEMMGYSHGLRPPSAAVPQNIIQPDEKTVVKTPRVSIKDKERGLKQLVKEMKLRNEKNRPPDWAVNYGKPVPRRFIFRLAIPSGIVL